MFADAPEMDGPSEVLWDEEVWRQSRANYRRLRRSRVGHPRRQARLRALLCEKQDWRCHYCQRQMIDVPHIAGQRVSDEQATLEHLTPVIEGGDTDEQNCRAACSLCNSIKGRLDLAIRALERSLREGFPHEAHYYADRLMSALGEWEARTAPAGDAR